MECNGLEKKAAGIGAIKNLIKSVARSNAMHTLLGGAANAATMEGAQYAISPEKYADQSSLEKGFRMATNVLFGAIGTGVAGAKARRDAKGVDSLFIPEKFLGWGKSFQGSIPKDIMLSILANNVVGNFTDAQKAIAEEAQANIAANNEKLQLAKLLGYGALGIGGAGLLRYLTKEDAPEQQQVSTLRFKMKGDKPGQEAEVVIPVDSPDMSNSMINNLSAGMRRNLQDTININSRKRDPMTGKLIPYNEWVDKYGDAVNADSDAESGEYNDGHSKYAHVSTRARIANALDRLEYIAKVAGMAPPPPPPGGPMPPPPGGPMPPPPSTPGQTATTPVSPESAGMVQPKATNKPTGDTTAVTSKMNKVKSLITNAANFGPKPVPGQKRVPWDNLAQFISSLGSGAQQPQPMQ